MQVIPAINVKSVDEAISLLQSAALFIPAGSWIHLDIHADTAYSDWLNHAIFVEKLGGFSLEVHCMRPDWEQCSAAWFAVGAKRAIVPARYMTGDVSVNIVPSFELRDSPELFAPSFFMHATIQILAVEPGASGQHFQESALEKIKMVRRLAPRAMIEVDGGITLYTGRRIRDAGADILVSSSYIWGGENPEKAYQQLIAI